MAGAVVRLRHSQFAIQIFCVHKHGRSGHNHNS